MTANALLVLCTCPDEETALRIAEELVGRGLAACVNLTGTLTSVYSWRGKVESARERLLLIKTSTHRYQEVESSITEMHPYELPEVIAVSVEKGLPAYLNWIRECTSSA